MRINSRISSFATYPATALAQKKQALKARGIKIFDFGTGDPIEPTPQFIRDALVAAVPEISQYPSVRGLPELRSEVSSYLARRFGVSVDCESQVLPATGSKESIYNLSFLLVEPGAPKDTIIASHPGYFIPERSAAVAGARFEPYLLQPSNNFLLELSDFASEVLNRAAIVWINYPNNPTGVECDRAYLDRQLEICRKYGILLCSDECYVDLYYSDIPPPSILELTLDGVLAFHSCSKRSGMTAYRTGFIAGDRDILAHYAKFRDTLGVATPVYTQAAAVAAWSDDEHVRQRCAVFQTKRAVFIEFFERCALEWVQSQAGLYFWVKAPKGEDGTSYAAKLLELGIVVSPGEMFAADCRAYFRIAIVPSAADCAEAVARWSEIIE